MATIIGQNGIITVAFYHQLGNQSGVVRRHWRVTAAQPPTITDQAWTDLISEQWGLRIITVMNQEARYLGAIGQYIFPTKAASVFSTIGAAQGEDGTAALPGQTSGLISLRTTTVGRVGRGRAYIPFPSTNRNSDSGEPTTQYQTNLALFKPVIADPREVTVQNLVNLVTPVVYSRTGNVGRPITGMLVRKQWATQRRRSAINRGDTLPF